MELKKEIIKLIKLNNCLQTDTFTYETKTEIGTNYLNEIFYKHKTKFDFSNYSTDWKFYDGYR